MKFLVAFNPVPNRSRKKRLSQLVHFLKQHNKDYDLYPTDVSLAQNQRYFQNHVHQYTDVIIVGGDGTIHQILNCLALPSDLNISIVPAGTGNDFARWIYGADRNNIHFILPTIFSDNLRTIKIGVCEFESGEQRYFHNVLGFGFDALLAKKLTSKKGFFRSLSYIKAAIKHIPSYQEQAVLVDIEGEGYAYDNLITAIANHQYFGNGLKIAPNAKPTDANLTLCRIEKLPLKTKLKQIFGLFSGEHVNHSFTDFRSIKQELSIKTHGIDIEADGEYIGQSPAKIYALTAAVKVKTPF